MTTASPAAASNALELQLFGPTDPGLAPGMAGAMILAMLDVGDGVSDLIFSPGRPPQVEQHGELTPVALPVLPMLKPEHTAHIARELIGGNELILRTLYEHGACDFSYSIPNCTRFRVNAFRQRGTLAIVMRVISQVIPTITSLNLPHALAEVSTLRNGLVLVTGPTGSGKTNTLYSSVARLNTPETNIMTAEDPVEFQLPGINQVQMKEQIGLNFASALRAFLRQDPNIILVGEIRDFETAEIAVKAALTGHLVLSTLHTNDAPSTISRLMNMGIEPFLVATSVNLICAQRLVRRICVGCKEPLQIQPSALIEAGYTPEEASKTLVQHGKGCATCNNTGYKGRVGLYEVMEINDELRELILVGASALEIKKKALEMGMITLRRSGLQKVAAGATTMEEVLRETVL